MAQAALRGGVIFVWLATIVFARATAPPARQTRQTAPPTVQLYDPDPAHLWNRLHAALFLRVAPDGREYGADRVDPLIWRDSTYLLRGASHDRAVKALREFVDTHGDRLIDDRVKRAMLQRDLWTISDWLAGRQAERPGSSPAAARKSIDELQAPLAAAISRLALTRNQIRSLPDNYAAASAGDLPANLLAPAGPWVLVGRPDGPVAIRHLDDDGPGRNSVFLVLIRLPGGRAATLDFLARLRSFAGPLWTPSGFPNPDVPAFPVGTQVALARRALLVDSSGEIVSTTLTEAVQLRRYTEIRPMTAQEFEDAHRIDADFFSRAGQEFDEFTLSRAAFFAGRAGGLVAMTSVRQFLTFSSHGIDPFETPAAGGPRLEFGSDAASERRVCKDCHAAPGVYSFNSYFPFRLSAPGDAGAARLSEISLADAEATAVAWKQQQADWRVLQSMLRR